MNSSKRGKAIALFTGAGVIGIAVLGFIYWKELAAQYHLYKLRSNADYFSEILEEPEGTPQRKAVRAFLRSDEGKEALFRQYAEVVLKVFSDSQQRGFDYLAPAIEGLGRRRSSVFHPVGTPKNFWYLRNTSQNRLSETLESNARTG